MEYNKPIYVKDYFDIHEFYSNIYGEGRTIVLMQVGSFHECYSCNEKGLDLEKLSQELNCVCSSKNSKKEISESNPRMIGFPIYVLDNFVDKLIDLNYTVVIIDQVTNTAKAERKVTRIESPATFVNKTKAYSINKANYLVSIYFDQISKSNELLCCGLSAYDLSTGSGYFYETYSKKDDTNFCLDDTIRFLELCPPQEIIIKFNFDENIFMSKEDIISYLKLNREIIYYVGDYSKYNKIKYQEKVFNYTFEFDNQLDAIQNLEIDRLNWARISLTALLEYVKCHQPILLTKIQKPIIFENKENLYIGNRGIEQLDILNTSNNKSMFKIIDNTKTVLGKKYLREQLINPLYNKDKLNLRYNQIENFINNDINDKIGLYLENIYDIDKIIRKMEMSMVHPYEIYQLINSLESYKGIINKLKNNEYFDLSDNKKPLLKLINKFNELFNLDIIKNINFVNYNEEEVSIYNDNIHQEIDELYNTIQTYKNFMNLLIDELSNYIDDKKSYMNKSSTPIDFKYNDRDGYYLILTKRRSKMLKDNLPKEINIGKIKINTNEFNFEDLPKGNNTKIKFNKLREISDDLVISKKEFANMTKELFYNDIKEIIDEFNNKLHEFSINIAIVDFINSGSITASKYGYCKPVIENYKNSFIETKELRHVIVENINDNIIYTPHDVSLGKELNGILLFGINSSGKSTLMKSIGLAIVMAQIGYYVSAKSFVFNPYKSLFTRINGNDDLYRGLSSFMVEMTELMSILKRNNNHTLVIGDEICRGTEEKSANIIVAYMLETLEKSNSSFITATHLHKIADMKSVKKLQKVKPYHLKVEYDDTKEIIIYKRKLVEGVGENFYGLQVAKYLMKDKDFNDRTLELLNEYENKKTSKYNSDIELDECYFCKKRDNLECHHINWQKDFKNKLHIDKPHIHKNKVYNLLVVCDKCHDKIDRDEIVVDGYVMTSNGIELEYKVNELETKPKKKYDDKMIKKIYKLKKKCEDAKMARTTIKEKYDMKVSTKTIKQIWNNEYI